MWQSSITRVGSLPRPRALRVQMSDPIASVSTESKSPSISLSISARTRSSRPGTPGVSQSRASRSRFNPRPAEARVLLRAAFFLLAFFLPGVFLVVRFAIVMILFANAVAFVCIVISPYERRVGPYTLP